LRKGAELDEPHAQLPANVAEALASDKNLPQSESTRAGIMAGRNSYDAGKKEKDIVKYVTMQTGGRINGQ